MVCAGGAAGFHVGDVLKVLVKFCIGKCQFDWLPDSLDSMNHIENLKSVACLGYSFRGGRGGGLASL